MKLILYFFSSLVLLIPASHAQETSLSASDGAQGLFNSSIIAKQNFNFLDARRDLERILTNFPHYPRINEVKKEWGEIMFILIHSDALVEESISYEVRSGDTLEKIAREHRTTIELIKKRNSLRNDSLKVGRSLSLWNKFFNIEVNKTSNRLYLKLDQRIIKVYSVSTGKAETITPLGEFVIKSRYPNPTWFHHGTVVSGGSPENFLGTRWLGFDKLKYGIHGTIYPELIGQSVSGGCIRMKNEDVEELYDIIPIGTKVVIRQDLQ